MDVSYDLLRAFVATAQAGSFAAAARRERVSVSAVSQRVRALETQLGAPLFERLGRRVRLLPAGRALCDALAADFARIDGALAALRDDAAEVRGRVAVGSPRGFGRVWLRPRLAALLGEHPALLLEVEFDVPSVLERRLREGALDLALLVRPPELAGVRAVPIGTERFVAVGAPRLLARTGAPRTLSEFRDRRWAVYDRDLPMHAPWWRASFGARAAPAERIACRVASLDELLALAEAGVALTVLPDYLVEEPIRAGRLVALEPAPGQHPRQRPARNTLFLAWRDRAPETARFRAVRDALGPPRPAPRARGG